MTIAVVYASRYGSTSGVAHHVAQQLGAETFDLADGEPDLSGFNLVILGTPVYLGLPLGLMKQFTDTAALDGTMVALFVGGLEADPAKHDLTIEEAFPPVLLERAVAKAFVGGRLLSRQIGMSDRSAFKRATGTKIKGDVDAIDREAIDRFVAEVRNILGMSPPDDAGTSTPA